MQQDSEITEKDFLDELIEEGTKKNPQFPKMAEAAYRRRVLWRELRAKREIVGMTQEDVAARMNTSRSTVARIERGEIDAKLSTVGRYATAIGHRLEWRVTRAR